MGLFSNPIAFPGFAASAVTLAIAWFVYAAAPRRTANRFLSLALACEGLAVGLNYGLMYSFTDSADAYAAQIAGFVAFALSLLFYVLFLGTLHTPWTRPLRSHAGRWLVAVAGAGLVLAQVVADRWVFVGVYEVSYAAWEGAPGTGFYWMVGISFLVAALGLVASVSALRRAKGAASRAKARAYVVAFSIHDFALVFQAAGWAALATVVDPASKDTVARVLVVAQPILGTLFVAALAYGILKTQLFDIDLKIKRSAGRAAVLGLVAATFFVVNEVAESFLPVDGLLPGLLAAGALAAAFYPLQRVAFRLLDQLLPNTRDTPEYRQDRKAQVYAAAVEEMFVDGAVTQKERRVLERLRGQLGLSVGDAAGMEKRWLAARGVA